ncbi:hypothetical protein, partial [Dactylosporangium sp. NPDC050588]|uniref:hypothetical protein n=1 Tax=Dactylosporangium sp. NPDC050588 TaxID=3157211 RepID=UPI0033E7714C
MGASAERERGAGFSVRCGLGLRRLPVLFPGSAVGASEPMSEVRVVLQDPSPNLGILLRYVHLDGAVSRAALAERMGLNRSTIMALTA